MTIDEAIKRLEYLRETRHTITYPLEWEALALGIEALERLKKCRKAGYKFYCQLMPGETEA